MLLAGILDYLIGILILEAPTQTPIYLCLASLLLSKLLMTIIFFHTLVNNLNEGMRSFSAIFSDAGR